MNKEFIIANGISIPAIGYGTWKIPSGDATFRAVTTALANGYRHLDCAAVYGNEASVGEAILASGIDRHELFITSKVWNTDRGYDKVMAAFTKTCQDLKTDYLDLYLIHWPANKHFSEDWDAINQDSWRALIDLYKSGRCKAIGVSNFLVKHLKSLMDSEIAPHGQSARISSRLLLVRNGCLLPGTQYLSRSLEPFGLRPHQRQCPLNSHW